MEASVVNVTDFAFWLIFDLIVFIVYAVVKCCLTMLPFVVKVSANAGMKRTRASTAARPSGDTQQRKRARQTLLVPPVLRRCAVCGFEYWDAAAHRPVHAAFLAQRADGFSGAAAASAPPTPWPGP